VTANVHFPFDKHEKSDQTDEDEPETSPRGKMCDAVNESDDSKTINNGTDKIELLVSGIHPLSFQFPKDEQDNDRPEGHIHEENTPPGEGGRHQPTNQRSKGKASKNRGDRYAENPAPFMGRKYR
jgi:hypothetical protein